MASEAIFHWTASLVTHIFFLRANHELLVLAQYRSNFSYFHFRASFFPGWYPRQNGMQGTKHWHDGFHRASAATLVFSRIRIKGLIQCHGSAFWSTLYGFRNILPFDILPCPAVLLSFLHMLIPMTFWETSFLRFHYSAQNWVNWVLAAWQCLVM